MSARTKRTGHRIYGLDFLKAVAAILIVLHHLQQDTGVRFAHLNFYGGHLNLGFVVELFFEISGLLVVLSELRRHSTPRGRARRWLDRFVRIWPMLALSVVVYAPLCWAYHVVTGEWVFGASQGLWSFFASLMGCFTGGATAPIHGMNNPTWYLNVLFVCYALYYACDFLNERWNVPRWVLFMGAMALGVGTRSYGLNLPFLQADFTGRGFSAFFLGVLMGEARQWLQNQRWLLPLSMGMVVLTGGCLLRGVLVDNEWALFTFALWPFVITLFAESTAINRLLEGAIVPLLGAASFEVYLWHTPFEVLVALICALAHIPIVMTPTVMLLAVVVIEALGILLHLCVERPIAQRLASR